MSDTQDTSDESDDKSKQEDEAKMVPAPSWLVWLVRAVSFTAMALILGYLIYLVVREPVPAQFDVTMDFEAVESRNAQWVLPVEVMNTSTEAVTAATVSVAMKTGDETVTHTTTIGIMGEGETVEIEVVFLDRPRPDNMTATVTIYQSP